MRMTTKDIWFTLRSAFIAGICIGIAGFGYLAEKNIIKKADKPVKVLGNGKLTKKLTVNLNAFSASAAEKINAAGGKTEVI